LGSFLRSGELSDLESSINHLQKAAQQSQPEALYTGSLGIAKLFRFQGLQELDDVEIAILNLQMAVDSTSDNNPDKNF
jgi:TPR repeat protein